MTARDTTTQSDPTDEVAADGAATPADPVEPPGVEPSGVDLAKRPDLAKRAVPAATATGAAQVDTEPDADDDPAATDVETGTTADATTADATTGKRRGRRRRRTSDDDATDGEAGDTASGSRPAAGSRRRRRWPLMALVLVAALFAGAMVVLWSATRPAPIAGLSGSQQAALDAASQAAVNLQTFRRASFDQDFANALASLTPEYGQQQFADRKDELQKQLTAGARDASATVQSAGLVSSTATAAVVLVVTTTVQTADDGTSTPFVFSRLQLSMQLIDGKWLVNDLKSVGLS